MSDTQLVDTGQRRIVVVSGLSGGDKAYILTALADTGYAAGCQLQRGVAGEIANRPGHTLHMGYGSHTARLHTRPEAFEGKAANRLEHEVPAGFCGAEKRFVEQRRQAVNRRRGDLLGGGEVE